MFLLALSAIPIGVLTVGWLSRYPIAHLAVVLTGFILMFNYTEGIQVSEALFGLYYVGYLGTWVLRSTCDPDIKIIRSKSDVIFILFMSYSLFALFYGLLGGWSPLDAINQWRVMLIFAFFFPVREAIIKDVKSLKIVIASIAILTTILVTRNYIRYIEAFYSAEALWEIAVNRSSRTGERVTMLGLFGFLYFSLLKSASVKLKLISVFMLTYHLVSLILSQSRTIWLAVVVGLVFSLLFLSRQQKIKLVYTLSIGVIVSAIAALVVLGPFFSIVIDQLSLRVQTSTSLSQDISLVNRFYEWETVYKVILESPIFGYGYGARYKFYSLVYVGTEFKMFSHSTLLTQLFRLGLLGSGLLLAWIVSILPHALRLIRESKPNSTNQALAVTALGFFAALSIASLTEAIFSTADGPFIVTIPLALLAGASARLHSSNG
ncbi:MAG: O-antigen ligase family protein [Bacteroidota bacterium]